MEPIFLLQWQSEMEVMYSKLLNAVLLPCYLFNSAVNIKLTWNSEIKRKGMISK